MRHKHTPWARIVIAAEAGKGVRFSAKEVARLIYDSAIEQRGCDDLWDSGYEIRNGRPRRIEEDKR